MTRRNKSKTPASSSSTPAIQIAVAKKRKNPKPKLTSTSSALVTHKVHPKHAALFRRHGLTSAHSHDVLSRYLHTLEDPWMCGPIRLGWGSFMPTSLYSGFNRITFTPGLTDQCFAVVFSPRAYGGAGSRANSGTLIYVGDAAGSTQLTAAATASPQGYVNASQLTAQIQSLRVVSSSLRVSVRYSANTVRGTLGAVFVPDVSYTSTMAETFNNVQFLNSTRWGNSDAAGQIGVEVTYRPVDTQSFQFLTDYTGAAANGFQQPALVVFGIGWPAGAGTFAVDVAAITHYETLGGWDGGAADFDASHTVAASGATMDQVGSMVSQAEPIKASINLIEAIDRGFENASNSMARTGMGLRTRGYLTGNFTAPQGTVVTDHSAVGSDAVLVNK